MATWATLPEIAEIKGLDIKELLRDSIELGLPVHVIGAFGKPLKKVSPSTWLSDLLVRGVSFCNGKLLGTGEFAMFLVEANKAWPDDHRTERQKAYSTPLLAILTDAIVEFFEPRKDCDAKKEAVVEWVKTQMRERGLPDSDNIAAAIFTIIKPVDHDPRKRRG